MKAWFITGGTPGGLGIAFADAVLEQGDRVALSTRRPEQVSAWANGHGERVLPLPVGVTDTAQITAAVGTAEPGSRFFG